MNGRHVLMVSHDAGGTVPPLVAVAHALVAAGDTVTVLGQPSIGARAERVGCRFVPFTALGDYDHRVSLEEQLDVAVEAIAGRSPGDDLLAVAAGEPPDALVIDCNLAGAAAAAETLGVPTVLLLHSVYRTFVDTWFADYWPLLEELINGTRQSFGLEPCRSWPDLFSRHDRLLSVVPERFDSAVGDPPPNLRHFGFLVPDPPAVSDPVSLPPGEEPLVLVGLSTTYQHQEQLLATIVEALGRLPVRALVTTGTALDLGPLRPPPNVRLRPFVPHPLVLPRTDVVVTHAGLGTIAGALAHGVPLVCAPISRDQPLNAARVAAVGAGVALGSAPSVDDVAAAVETVLRDPSYRAAAAAMAEASRAAGGAVAAAADIDSLARDRR